MYSVEVIKQLNAKDVEAKACGVFSITTKDKEKGYKCFSIGKARVK